jgi:hypothetical protein
MTERMNESQRRGTICSILAVALFFGGVTITRPSDGSVSDLR